MASRISKRYHTSQMDRNRHKNNSNLIRRQIKMQLSKPLLDKVLVQLLITKLHHHSLPLLQHKTKRKRMFKNKSKSQPFSNQLLKISKLYLVKIKLQVQIMLFSAKKQIKLLNQMSLVNKIQQESNKLYLVTKRIKVLLNQMSLASRMQQRLNHFNLVKSLAKNNHRTNQDSNLHFKLSKFLVLKAINRINNKQPKTLHKCSLKNNQKLIALKQK